MNEHFKRILDEATAKLDTSLKDAQNAAVRAKKDMSALAEFGEHLPHSFLDKFNHLLIGDREFEPSSQYPGTLYMSVMGQQIHFLPEIKQPLKGKYRAFVLLQKID